MGRLAARLNHYRFQSLWTLPCTCEEAFDALADLLSYPDWWPEVKEVTVVDEVTAAVVIRAVLPYELRFMLEQQRVDRSPRALQAAMRGDLEGWSRWSVAPGREGGCEIEFEEDVVVRRPLLTALAPVGRPLLKANHWIMMRRGEAGLRRFLSRNRRESSEV